MMHMMQDGPCHLLLRFKIEGFETNRLEAWGEMQGLRCMLPRPSPPHLVRCLLASTTKHYRPCRVVNSEQAPSGNGRKRYLMLLSKRRLQVQSLPVTHERDYEVCPISAATNEFGR